LPGSGSPTIEIKQYVNVLAIYELGQVVGAHPRLHLVKLVTRVRYVLAPNRFVVWAQTKPDNLKNIPVVEFEK